MPNNSLYTGMSFDYNHNNERTFRRGSNLDRQFAYDESSHLIGEYTGNGALIVEYVWLGDRPIAAVYPSNRIVYIVTDNQSKPRRGIDATTQQVVWSWDADAFGVLQPATGLANGIEMNLRFPGQYYDVQSGLYYNHNRYYNPELGRYMEVDPIGLEGGLNPYAYAGSDPVNKVDPMGLAFETLPDIALAAISIGEAWKNPTLLNIAAAIADTGAAATPFIPAVAGLSVRASNAVDKVATSINTAKNIVDPNTLLRTHSIEGKRSVARVQEIAADMRINGYNGSSIDVAEFNGNRYIIDGHHRAAAAKQTGTQVHINVISDIANHHSSFQTIEDIIKSAESVGPDRLTPRRR